MGVPLIHFKYDNIHFLNGLSDAGFTFKVHIKGLHSHEISDVLKDTLLADVIVCE